MGTISVSLPSDGSTADVSDYNSPITSIVNEVNGELDNTNIAANAAIAGSKLADNGIDLEAKASTDSGWREVTDSLTYASATTITAPTDATTKYSVGDKLRLTQTTVKYFYITGVAATTLTITGGSDYTLVNAAISDVSYSKALTPLNFPQSFGWTPTLSGLFDDADWTKACTFAMHGKTIVARLKLTSTTTSPMGGAGSPTFTLPVASVAYTNVRTVLSSDVGLVDADSSTPRGWIRWLTTTTADIVVENVAATYPVAAAITTTVPFTWTTSDAIECIFIYGAA